MNAEHDAVGGPDAARSRLHPALAAAMAVERAKPPDQVEAEHAEAERSMLAVHRDPTLTERDTAASEALGTEPDSEAWRRTQVRWVRPTDLAMQGSARATGWGLDLRAELGQRLRAARGEQKQHPAEGRSERAKRLPDLSIAGRRRQARQAPARSGMGVR